MECPIKLVSYFMTSLEVNADEMILLSTGGKLTLENTVELAFDEGDHSDKEFQPVHCRLETFIIGKSTTDGEAEDAFSIKLVSKGIFEVPNDSADKLKVDEDYRKKMNLRFVNRMFPVSRELLLNIFEKIRVNGALLPWHISELS